jgi:hypothetical protein
MLLLLIIHQFVYSQIPDTARDVTIDTVNVPTEKLNVVPDTIQYNEKVVTKTATGKDTVIIKKKVHSPRQATIRSAIIPGWGQVYNKKIWKVPIVYAGVGIPGYLFFDNKRWYNRTKYALSIVTNGRTNPDSLAAVHPQLKTLVERKAEGSLINYRNQFRRDMDLSILITLLMWGLNVVDATVDGHLKGFDVGDDLSMKIKPSLMAGNFGAGVSLVVSFK